MGCGRRGSRRAGRLSRSLALHTSRPCRCPLGALQCRDSVKPRSGCRVMAHPIPLKPNHKAIRQYYAALQAYRDQHVGHEGATETAFQRLLADTALVNGWTLIPKLSMKVGGKNVIPDGTLRDGFELKRGF